MIVHYIPPYVIRRSANIASIRVTRSELRRKILDAINVYRRDIFRVSGWKCFDAVLMYVSFPLHFISLIHLLPGGRFILHSPKCACTGLLEFFGAVMHHARCTYTRTVEWLVSLQTGAVGSAAVYTWM
jgi:hypothetical protein